MSAFHDLPEYHQTLSEQLYQVLEDVGVSTELREHQLDRAITQEIYENIRLNPKHKYIFGSSYEGTTTWPLMLIRCLLLLHIKVRLPVLLFAVKTVEGDFRFSWTISPNIGQTHKENPNLVRFFYMICTMNDIYKQYNNLHEH